MSFVTAIIAPLFVTAEDMKNECINLLSENGYEIGEYNPHRVSAWLVNVDHRQFLAIGSCEQDAIDNIADENLIDECLCDNFDPEDIDSELTFTAGNASETFCYDAGLIISKVIQA